MTVPVAHLHVKLAWPHGGHYPLPSPLSPAGPVTEPCLLWWSLKQREASAVAILSFLKSGILFPVVFTFVLILLNIAFVGFSWLLSFWP